MSNGIVPQFNYGPGFATSFNPTYAARNKEPLPNAGQVATRHDSITSSGLRQAILERVDRVFTLDFPVVPLSDLAGWDEFISWAIAGLQFQYVPDTTNPSTYVTCSMVTMKVPYKFVGYQIYTISFDCRIELTAEIGS